MAAGEDQTKAIVRDAKGPSIKLRPIVAVAIERHHEALRFDCPAVNEWKDLIATDCLVRKRKIRLYLDPVNGKAR